MAMTTDQLIQWNAMEREIARLTRVLHAKRCHPDYTYVVVPPGDFLGGGPLDMAGGGFEPNEEWNKNCVGPDKCWMRKKEKA